MSKIGIAGLQLEAFNGDSVDAMEEAIDAVVKRYSWVDMLLLGFAKSQNATTSG
jgi:hypothetical protein